ncbi:MAG TPA: RsiV family protein [Bacteroidia bacterium]
MKIILQVCLLAVIHFTGFSNTLNLNNTTLKLPDNFYMKLKGKIGEKLSITMDIIKRRDTTDKSQRINGSYYYDNIGMPLEIAGKINDAGKFELIETNNKGDVTGTFKGEFTSENEIKGVWIHPKTKKETPFALTKTTENIAQFDFKDYYHENCEYRKRNLKSIKKDTLNWTDTLCSDMSISLTNIKNLKANACKRINAILLNSLLQTGSEGTFKTINALLHSVDDLQDLSIMNAQYGMNIVSNEANALCISISYWANTGGAHPNGCLFYLNFNPQTGDTIMLKNILLPEAKDNLIAIAKIKFIKANGDLKENGWFYDDAEFKLTDNVAITKGGLLFQYQAYEVGAYALGMPQFFIPNSELKGIIKPEYLK